jgi:hypothetical protein
MGVIDVGGVGNDKRCYLDWMFAPEDLATMQLVRQAFDPSGLANPGKIFPTPARCGESQRRWQGPEPADLAVSLQGMEVF